MKFEGFHTKKKKKNWGYFKKIGNKSRFSAYDTGGGVREGGRSDLWWDLTQKAKKKKKKKIEKECT